MYQDNGYNSYKRKSGFNAIGASMANGYGSHRPFNEKEAKQVDTCEAGLGSGDLHKCDFKNMPKSQREAARDRSIKSDEYPSGDID